MAQTGITEPWKGRNGQVHTDDDAQGDSFRCQVGRCSRPCEHCKADRCKGFLALIYFAPQGVYHAAARTGVV